MKPNTWKLVSLGLLAPLTGLTVFMVIQLNQAASEVPERLIPENGHGSPGGEAKAAAGHGEAKVADSGHGEAKAAEGHGGSPAPADASRAPASIGLVSIDELFVNIGWGENVKSLGLKVELELFDEESRPLFEQNTSGIKHTMIEASRAQDADRLVTVSGKLYFKEFLVTRLNTFFKKPVVREVHFSSFYLQ